jgi:hypothetical protein
LRWTLRGRRRRVSGVLPEKRTWFSSVYNPVSGNPLEAAHMMKFADPSGAKAHDLTNALMYGLKPVPSKTVSAGAKAHFFLKAITARDPLRGFPESCPDTSSFFMWDWPRPGLKPAVLRGNIRGAEAPRSLRRSTLDRTWLRPRGEAWAD